MDDGEIWSTLVGSVYAGLDLDEQWPNATPLLAHYTSLDALESILKNDEIWFSNPLFMNDLDEIQFGIVHGASNVKTDDAIREALGTGERHRVFCLLLDDYINSFVEKHLLDTYVFCTSEHDPNNHDGMLSMWRGYGGNGKGAALVFDMAKVTPVKSSPIKIARVIYGSYEERFTWLRGRVLPFAKELHEKNIPDDKLYLASAAVFELIKVFALISKHRGFREEREWRFIYMSDGDEDEKLKPMQYYLNGRRGVEPKLRFKIGPMDGITPPDLSFDHILVNILLGPSTSSALAIRSVQRMLELIGKPKLKDRLIASSIPLRAT